MLKQYLDYIERHQLIKPNQTVLLAVSGGVDSMVMVHLFHQSGIPFAMAHCNFQLRGQDSVLDQKLVEDYSGSLGVKLHTCTFETVSYAQNLGVSTQMAARELRFEYFDRLAKEHHYPLLATAHHADDQAETFFVNLTRGTGVKGLRGILPKTNPPFSTSSVCLIHPLLFASKAQIKEYAIDNKIPYRDDISNASDKYIRNKIRLHLLPDLHALNPNFQAHLLHTMQMITHTQEVLEVLFAQIESQVLSRKGEEIHIHIPQLLSQMQGLPILYLENLLLPFGYCIVQIQSLWKQLNEGVFSGKIFDTSSHQLLLNRDEIIIRKKGGSLVEEFYSLCPPFQNVDSPISLVFEKIPSKEVKFDADATIAYLAEDCLQYPLKLRKWKAGDYFYPFGGKGRKKLSDFFSNEKLSLFEKEKVWLLCSGEDIVWVVGYRIDHRYRLRAETSKVLKITFKS